MQKQSTAKKRHAYEEDKCKVCEICEDNQKEYHIKSCAAGRIISCNGDSDLGDTCGRDSAHNQQFRTCRCIWKKDCSTAAGNDGWMAYVFPLLLFCGVAFVVSNKGNRIAYIKTVAGVVLLVQCCVLFELIDEKGGSVGKAIAVRLVPAIVKLVHMLS